MIPLHTGTGSIAGSTYVRATPDTLRRGRLRDHTGADEASALAFLSAAADVEVSQAVNLVVGVHCLIHHRDLA